MVVGDEHADEVVEHVVHHRSELERVEPPRRIHLDVVGRPAILVGHSLGGYLSLAQAILEPGSVSGLVLVAAGPGFRSDKSRDQWNASIDPIAAEAQIPEGQEEITKRMIEVKMAINEQQERFRDAIRDLKLLSVPPPKDQR